MDKKQIFDRLLAIHIESKTTGSQYHKDTEKAYEFAFDAFHTTEEMKQDLGLSQASDCEDTGQEAYDLIENLKAIIEKDVKQNKDIGYDNRLRGLAERATDLCGTFKQYTKEQEEEEDTEEEIENPLYSKKI